MGLFRRANNAFGESEGEGEGSRSDARAVPGGERRGDSDPSPSEPTLVETPVSSLAESFPELPSLSPTVLTRDRIEAWLTGSGYTFFIDSDGDIGGVWHNRVFYFLLLGEHHQVLQVRGQWQREANVARIGDILEACNGWNSDRIWPKSYARVRDDGSVVICADLTLDAEHGLTESQLDQTLRCGLATTSAFFDHLEHEFPDPLAYAPPTTP